MIAVQTAGMGMATPAARVALLLFWAGGTAAAFARGELTHGWTSGVAYGLSLLGVLALTQRRIPLTPRAAGAIVACAILALALGLVDVHEPRHVFVVDIPCMLVGLMIVRGNRLAGLLGSALAFVVVGIWLVSRSAGPEGAVRVLAYPIMVFAGCVLLTIWLSAILRREQRTLETEPLADPQRVTAQILAIPEDDIRQIGDRAAPALRDIADGRDVDPAFRALLTSTEAAVRDALRTPRLLGSPLGDALDRARSRGVRVVLLGEGLASLEPTDALTEHLESLIEDAGLREVTIRVPSRRRPITVVAEGGSSFLRGEFARDGEPGDPDPSP